MAQSLLTVLAIFISVCSNCVTLNSFDDKDAISDTYYNMPGKDNNIKRSEQYPETSNSERNDRPFSLADVLNQRVSGQSQMCPRQNVLLFFLTGDMQHLRACMNNSSLPASSQVSQDGNHQRIVSYSGKLLKRILQNIDEGTVNVDLHNGDDQDQTEDRDVGGAEKRGRLSINSALGSLVELLKQESRRHRRPQYAFHQDLLHLG